MWAPRFAFASLLLACGCEPGGSERDWPPPGSATSGLTVLARAEAPAALSPPEPAWVLALRAERWADGGRLVDAEPPAVQRRPEVRYARAAAAARVGDHARVVELLAGLDAELPLLAARIRERRARSLLEVGGERAALDYFSVRTDAGARLLLARAHAKLGETVEARRVLEALLRRLPKRAATCEIEAPARALLAEVLPASSAAARALEHRWLALKAPLCASADGAAERLDGASAALRLTKRERAARAKVFAEAGLIQRAEAEVALVDRAPGPAAEAGSALSIAALARYSARRELERAAELFTRAAAENPGHAAEWLFYAARARARGGLDATPLFARVFKAHPKSPFADPAEYQRAQWFYASGRFEDAVRAFDAYLARRGERARFAADAIDERAVSLLALGRGKAAAKSFAELARSAGDARERARYEQLEGVAWLREGDAARARARFEQVIRDYPLSFAALVAATRLEALGETAPPAPPPVAGASLVSDLELALPAEAELLHRVGLDAEAETALTAAELLVTRFHASRATELLCGLYGRLAPSARRYRVAQSAVSAEELRAVPRADRLWAWDCVYPRPYAGMVATQGGEFGIPPELVYAVMRQESGFRPEVVSPADAVGLLQILPSTGARLASELALPFERDRLTEPSYNVRLGTRYLRKLLDVFSGNLALAAASYNAGPDAVLRWLDGARSLELDVFVARIPFAETRTYVERVIGNYARYRHLQGHDARAYRLDLALPAPRTAGVELY